MIPKRIAVSTVFVCIGILLLSACGLPLGPAPRVRPIVLQGDFAVYAPDQTLLAVGHLNSSSDPSQIAVRITLHSAECLNEQKLDLLGALDPTLNLHSAPGPGPQVTLRSSTAPVYDARTIRVLPFNGVMTLTRSCADRTGPVEVTILPRQ